MQFQFRQCFVVIVERSRHLVGGILGVVGRLGGILGVIVGVVVGRIVGVVGVEWRIGAGVGFRRGQLDGQ